MADENSTETVLNYTKKGIVALADDIVQQLHDWQHIVDESKGDAVVVMLSGRVFGDAADEIERLRAVRDECERQFQAMVAKVIERDALCERLRAACNIAQAFISHDKNCGFVMGRKKDCDCGFDAVWKELEETRRG